MRASRRKKSDGSLVYSLKSYVRADDAYTRTYYLTNEGTKIDSTFAEAAKFVEISIHYIKDDKGNSLTKYTVNGREVSKDEFFNWDKRRDETVFKEYEQKPYRGFLLDSWGSKEFDIRGFLNVYHGEE